MNHILAQTLKEELKRLLAEGEEFLPLDDASLSSLKAIAAKASAQKNAPADAPGQKKSANAHRRQKLYETEDAEAARLPDNLAEIKFVEKLERIAPEAAPAEEKILKVKQNQTNPEAPLPKPQPFILPEGDKNLKWNFLRELVLADPVCNSHVKPGKKVVFGIGNLDAKIFFCGEAPGADEEIQGEPFVGRAGQLLTKIIGAMGLDRSQVYIGNIMNWRPEIERGNRPPTQEEMEYCLPYLKAQIDIVQPEIIVALGMTAVHGLLGFDPTRRLGKIRGKWTKFGERDLMITYHPSFLLQYASAAMKRLVWEDMMAVMERAGIPISQKQRGYYAGAK